MEQTKFEYDENGDPVGESGLLSKVEGVKNLDALAIDALSELISRVDELERRLDSLEYHALSEMLDGGFVEK